MSTAMMSAPSCGQPDRVAAALPERRAGDERDLPPLLVQSLPTPHSWCER